MSTNYEKDHSTQGGEASNGQKDTSENPVGIFTTGSDVEIAEHLQVDLQAKYGEVVFCEGEFWHYGKTQWSKISRTELWLGSSVYNGAAHGKTGKGIIRQNSNRIESIIKHLERLHDKPGFFNNTARGVNCLSGFVEFAADGTPNLVDHSPVHLQRDTLQGYWEPNRRVAAPPPGSLIHTLLYGSTLGDPEQSEKIEALLRLAGAVVTGSGTRGIDPKVFILKGESKAGKGQMLIMFRGLVPASAQCSISPSQFADKNFVVELAGKLLNTYDELGSTYAVTSEVFKNIGTGDPITGCRKYGNPFTFAPVAQNIFACNLLPSFRGGVDKAVLNRLYILQFDRAIPKEERVSELGKRIVVEEMDLLLGLAIEGASRLIRDGRFPHLESAEAELAELAETDSVVAWFKDRIKRTMLEKVNTDGTRSPVRLTTSQMYADYKTVSESQGHDRKSIVHVNVFSQRLRSLGLKRVNANGFRGFVGVCFKSEGSPKYAPTSGERRRRQEQFNLALIKKPSYGRKWGRKCAPQCAAFWGVWGIYLIDLPGVLSAATAPVRTRGVYVRQEVQRVSYGECDPLVRTLGGGR
jgi:phage/plasmid-associated DNA primase